VNKLQELMAGAVDFRDGEIARLTAEVETLKSAPKCSECGAPCTDHDLIGNGMIQDGLGEWPKYWCGRCINYHLTLDENKALKARAEAAEARELLQRVAASTTASDVKTRRDIMAEEAWYALTVPWNV
jgi:hypothetical protein